MHHYIISFLFLSWVWFDSSFLFFLALLPRLSCSRLQSALTDWDGTCLFFTSICSSISLCVLLDTQLIVVLRSHSACSLSTDICYSVVFCQVQSCLIKTSPVECFTWSLPSLPVACGQGFVCFRALPSGLYSHSVELAARLSGRDRTPSRISQVFFYAPVFSWVIFQFCVCLIWLVNSRLPEFVLWTIHSLFDLTLPLRPFVLWHNNLARAWIRRRGSLPLPTQFFGGSLSLGRSRRRFYLVICQPVWTNW